ncbi:MAG: integration host factor subunit alpha [Magnetococcales bacterium]|nr:integration host factor subunit alpha [Magnetococcales bacterium]NGZ27128.1 integration host factor subunit alpha [Magnetococcales bacterium]
MTKAEIVESIYRKMGITKREAADLVESFFELVRQQLEDGESIKLSGFGNFEIREKRSRRGRNPKTGEEIEITARKVLTFKPSQILRQKVNGDDAET